MDTSPPNAPVSQGGVWRRRGLGGGGALHVTASTPTTTELNSIVHGCRGSARIVDLCSNPG